MSIAMTIETGELVGLLTSVGITLAGAVSLAWKFMTNQIERAQNERAAEAKAAAEDRKQDAKVCAEERKAYLETLERIEEKHERSDVRVLELVARVEALLRERGVPGPVIDADEATGVS